MIPSGNESLYRLDLCGQHMYSYVHHPMREPFESRPEEAFVVTNPG